MTVRELMDKLYLLDGDMLVMIPEEEGFYNFTTDCYTDIDEYFETEEDWKANKNKKTRTVLKIF